MTIDSLSLSLSLSHSPATSPFRALSYPVTDRCDVCACVRVHVCVCVSVSLSLSLSLSRARARSLSLSLRDALVYQENSKERVCAHGERASGRASESNREIESFMT